MRRNRYEFALCHEWLTWLRGQGRSERTVSVYRSAAARLLMDHVGGGPAEVTPSHVAEFLSSVGEQGPAGRTQALKGIRSLMRFALRRGVIKLDPTEEFEARKPKSRPPVALTEEELLRYLIAAWHRGGDHRLGAFLLTLGLGARRSEIAGITPDDVGTETVHLRVCKGGKQRHVELSPFARLGLELLRPHYNGTVLGGISPGTLSKWAIEAARDSGLYPKVKRRSMHVLRSSYASHLIRRGTPVTVVRDLLGHESIATTNIYAVSFDDERRRATEKLDFSDAGGSG